MEQHLQLGPLEGAVRDWVTRATADNVVERIRQLDAGLWKPGDAQAAASIENRLGWLNAPQDFLARIDEVIEFADEVRADGFSDVVLLGMGGSSLCVEVIRDVFGQKQGFPRMHILDSTHPAQVRRVEAATNPDSTLYVVASKSGTTLETECFYLYFWDRMVERHGEIAPGFFAAITDPGSKLANDAVSLDFRKVFLNPPDIGGRFSALSYFGLVPAALMGVDVKEFLERALEESWKSKLEEEHNPGFMLGAAIGVAAEMGSNRLTTHAEKTFRALPPWVEQLVAESTGKEGKGILPVGLDGGTPLDNRVRVVHRTSAEPIMDSSAPTIDIVCQDAYDLAALFYRWEFATAVAGVALQVNPFDEPNVTESKTNTNRVLQQGLPEDLNLSKVSLADALQSHAGYIAILAYLPQTKEAESALEQLREKIQRVSNAPVTIGFGPRFLHSTGQLHKGGPRNGLFVQIVDSDVEDLAIPEKPFDFGTLIRAQAEGDYQALSSKGLPIYRYAVDSLEEVPDLL